MVKFYYQNVMGIRLEKFTIFSIILGTLYGSRLKIWNNTEEFWQTKELIERILAKRGFR